MAEAGDNHLLETIKSIFVPIHPAGVPFIVIFSIVTAIMAYFSPFLGYIGIILTLWCVYFFRNPARIVPLQEGLIISPADGVVQKITTVVPPQELELGEEERVRVSVFLNVFNVHVNRVPLSGKVTKLHYHKGLFLNANLDKASEDNERQCITVEAPDGTKVGFVQIAGLVARRILCELVPNQEVKVGDVFGLIRFGSRVDIYLPPHVQPQVMIGQTMVAGESIIADMKQPQGISTGRTC
jgi:phosphatidylserine decarboxylase